MAKSEGPRPEVVALRLAALRQLSNSVAPEAPAADPDLADRPDRDGSPLAVARRLDELRALCALADHLRLARRAPPTC